jgi:hypothetical protein
VDRNAAANRRASEISVKESGSLDFFRVKQRPC